MTFGERSLIPSARGLQFNMEQMTPDTPIKRPRPNFRIYWDDLYLNQQRYVLLSHNFQSPFNLRDRGLILKIKELLQHDEAVWHENKFPIYLRNRISIDATNSIFMEMIPILYGHLTAKGRMTMQQRRFICTQIEKLTDIYFASLDDLMELSMLDQAKLVENYRNLLKFRKLMVDSANQFPEMTNYFPFPQEDFPQAASTPKVNIDMRPPRLNAMSSMHSTIFSSASSTTTNASVFVTPVTSNTNIQLNVTQPTLTDDLSDPDIVQNLKNFDMRDVASNFNQNEPVSSSQSQNENNQKSGGAISKTSTSTTTSILKPLSSSKVFEHRQNDSAFMTAFNINNTADDFDDNIQKLKLQKGRFPFQPPNHVDNVRGNVGMPKYNYPFDANRGGNFVSDCNQVPHVPKNHYPQHNVNYSGNLGSQFNHPPPNMFDNAYAFKSENVHSQYQHLPPQQQQQPHPFMPQQQQQNIHNELSQMPINFKEFWDAFFNSSRSFNPASNTQSFMPKIHDWYPKFNGSDDCALDQILSQWEKLAINCRMTPESLLSNVHLLLRGDALRWHNAIGSDMTNWNDYKVSIIDRFQSPDRIVITFMSNSNEQKETEKFDVYFARLKMLMKQARGEIFEKQLITRLITGLRDTRCRDVVRSNSSLGTINWNKIIHDINQIEVEYDLISHAHKFDKQKFFEVKHRSEEWKFNPKSYPPSRLSSETKPSTFMTKSPYFVNKSETTPPKNHPINDFKKPEQQINNFKSGNSGKPWQWRSNKPQYSQNFREKYTPKVAEESLSLMKEPPAYIEPSSEVLEELEANREIIMCLYEDNDWSEEHLMMMLSTSTCSNCDKPGHIIENCDLLMDDNKFRPQCLVCHAFDINTENCCQRC